jgi:HD-GYP domain-containing protein (c-di-GMP phosphodiesterase class II)
VVEQKKKNVLLEIPKPFPLTYDVQDLKGNILVRKGEPFSTRLLQKLHRSAPVPNRNILLREHAVFGEDLIQAIQAIPFSFLFYKKNALNPFDKVIKEAGLPYWGMEVLEYFKQRDPSTYWHSLRVFILTSIMSLEFITPPKRKLIVASMGPLHDLGKVSVPLAVLQKKTLLTLEERNQIRHHVFSGAVLLSYHQDTTNLLGPKVALEHHERLNGSGYPFGLRLSDRTVEIVAVCDVYDALISPRPYRNRAFDMRTALEVMTQLALDGIFSLALLRFLIALHRREKSDYKKLIFSKEKRGLLPEKNLYGQFLESE